MIGKTLGHYKIGDQPLGKGGMGEVYRAKDLKLGRDVAIKVLPEEFARDADRVARFQREAKLLASLNHPNIAAIYGLEEFDGIQFLVLELVEGETLVEQLKRGPIPVEESLKLALQIAEALEAAHEKGVIHRDLKPANIKVTPDGKVKVLDFGLAKAFAGDQADLNLSNSPTLSNAATQQGVILGTAAYMSPEQARGETVDKRADIWAFGCVLFEMLTGRGTFEGRTVSDVLASVLKSDPGWNRLPPNLHSRIHLLLERCLEKEAKNRYSGINDARVDIQKVLTDPGGVFAQPITTAEPQRKLRTIPLWIAATVVLIAVIAVVAGWNLKKTEPRPVSRFCYELPKDQQFSDLGEHALAVSPDGRQFVYSTSAGLYLRSMNELDAKLLPGTGGIGQRPFFSPDGKWVGFFSSAEGRLKKIAINGGAPVTLADVSSSGSFTWDADDTIVYAQPGKGIMRVFANAGTPEAIVKADTEWIVSPQVLPDDKSVLFTRITSQPYKVMVQSLKSGERKELFAGFNARYLPTGHIVYSIENGNNLFAIPFNLHRLEVTGSPVSVLEDILWARGEWQLAVSESGTLVYVPGTSSAVTGPQRTLVWVDRKGKEEPLPDAPNAFSSPRISPDGTRVALTVTTAGNDDIWIYDFGRKTMTRLTFNEGIDAYPLWTHDGKRIAFLSSRDGNVGVYWKEANGTGKDLLLTSMRGRGIVPSSWSGDGKTLVMTDATLTPDLRFDIGALSMEGDHARKPLLQEKYNELQPQISPDGRWMAYTSNESGQNQIYVRPFPEVEGGRWPVSTTGGDSPLWSPDGRELFYRSGDAAMAVSVKTEPTFSLETPKILFRGTYVSASAMLSNLELNPWDISPDGKRFLMMKEPASTGGGPRKINIVLNWFEELKQRVPTK